MIRRNPEKRPVILRRAGFTVIAFSTLLFGLFGAGETFGDAGGWKALGLVSAWAVPLAVSATIAWFRPDWQHACARS